MGKYYTDSLSGNIGEDPSSVVFKAHRKAIDENLIYLL